MRGKEKCRALKEIRRQIAEKNDIPYAVSQCTYQGECKGTCPKCEAELRYLERELAIRQGLGKAVAVVGISTSVCAGLTACSPVDGVKNAPEISVEDLAGYIMPAEEPEVEGDTEGPDMESQDTSDAQESIQAQETEESVERTIPQTGESQEIVDDTAGRIPLPEDIDEMVMGEILPPEETSSVTEGDIAIPEDWMESTWSDEQMGEQTP